MSGRAGRRGLDDRGIVILIVDEKMGPDVGKGLLKVIPAYLFNLLHFPCLSCETDLACGQKYFAFSFL